MSENKQPAIIQEFRNLYDYVVLMGRHINEIHRRLEAIEKSIQEINLSHNNFVQENQREIAVIRETMVNKDEFNSLIEKMKVSVGEALPPLPTISKEATPEKTSSSAIGQ